MARFEINQRVPDRKVSAATLTRFLQPIKGCWTWAVPREDVHVDRNPWLVVRPRRKVKGRATLGSGRTALAVDADLVIGLDEILAIANACAREGSSGAVVDCFVLVMALSGLRPGEAAGLLWEDVDLPVGDQRAGWLSVRPTHRPVASRWLDPGGDPEWGPLKDRDLNPLPPGPPNHRCSPPSLSFTARPTVRVRAVWCSTATANLSTTTCSAKAFGNRHGHRCGHCART